MLYLVVPLALFGISQCALDVLTRFFPRTIVIEALQKNGIDEEQAQAVASALIDSDPLVIKEIEERAAKMDPNPLLDDGSAEVRGKLFKEAITDVFMRVMKEQGYTDTSRSLQILDSIQEGRLIQFQKCEGQNILPGSDE